MYAHNVYRLCYIAILIANHDNFMHHRLYPCSGLLGLLERGSLVIKREFTPRSPSLALAHSFPLPLSVSLSPKTDILNISLLWQQIGIKYGKCNILSWSKWCDDVHLFTTDVLTNAIPYLCGKVHQSPNREINKLLFDPKWGHPFRVSILHHQATDLGNSSKH